MSPLVARSEDLAKPIKEHKNETCICSSKRKRDEVDNLWPGWLVASRYIEFRGAIRMYQCGKINEAFPATVLIAKHLHVHRFLIVP